MSWSGQRESEGLERLDEERDESVAAFESNKRCLFCEFLPLICDSLKLPFSDLVMSPPPTVLMSTWAPLWGMTTALWSCIVRAWMMLNCLTLDRKTEGSGEDGVRRESRKRRLNTQRKEVKEIEAFIRKAVTYSGLQWMAEEGKLRRITGASSHTLTAFHLISYRCVLFF